MADQTAYPVNAASAHSAPQAARGGHPNRGGRRRGPIQSQDKAQTVCRFYARGSCRAGDACPYLHERYDQNHTALSTAPTEPELEAQPPTAVEQEVPTPTRNFQAPPVAASRVVQKPVPRSQQQDPRRFQIDQLKRRFDLSEVNLNDGTTLTFKLTPSDPDFPFDLESGLHCVLFVPQSFPSNKPTLRITNKEMGRGFQINVEKGFDTLASASRTSTLLGLMNNLDRQLESLLTGKEAETIKIVKNASNKPEPLPELEQPPPSPPPPDIEETVFIGPIFTPQQFNDAENKRKMETRQLEARLGRQPRFEKAADGMSYMLPLEPRRRQDLPVPLQNVNTIELTVPRLYPLEPCRIRLFGVQPAASQNTELAFAQHIARQAQDGKAGNLLGYMNYLASNLHILATKQMLREDPPTAQVEKLNINPEPMDDNIEATGVSESQRNEVQDEDRPHIYHVSRPPEWDAQFNGEDDEDDEDTDASFDEDDDYDEETDGTDGVQSEPEDTGPERGIMLSFPYLELHGVEILELESLAITVRCTRCKDNLDVTKLRHDSPRIETCKKCNQAFGIGFRHEIMHINSVRAGWLDLDGCTVADLLPSQFIPTCAECSTPQPPPGVVAVRGDSTMAFCRECHKRMSFKIPEVKFLQVSASSSTKHRPPPRRKVRENLGITSGAELPQRGRCEHYRKSYRWFRFSCCQKVFPCDKCHDLVSDHLTEFANRMLCGWCSREQLYRPETCAFCRNYVIGKKGGGFWEGGKGTRDKNLMSRKDPRKFKRRTGLNAKVGGSSSKK